MSIYRRGGVIFGLFLGICIFIYQTSIVEATVMIGEIESYGNTYINYFMNHNYIESDKPYLYDYSVESLEKVRTQLVKEGKLEDKPVVWEIPSNVFEVKSNQTIIEKKAKCELSYGDRGGISPDPYIENCYSIYFVGESNYKNLLKITLSLSQLTDRIPKIVIGSNNLSENLDEQIKNYSGGTYFSKPIWSLDSKFVSFGEWKDGIFNYEIFDVEKGEYLKTDSLVHGVATEPLWLPTGRYFIFGSLSEINIYDVIFEKTERVDISHLTEGQNFELLISYDLANNRVLFAFDKSLLANYDIYEYDLQTKMVKLRSQNVSYLSWKNNDRSNSLMPVTSPDGQYEADVEEKIVGSVKSVKKIAEAEIQVSPTEIPTNTVIENNKDINLKFILLVLISGTSLTGFLGIGWYLGTKHPKKRDQIINDKII